MSKRYKFSKRNNNTFVDMGTYYEVMDKNNNVFFIDKEDKEIIEEYYWRVDKQGYVIGVTKEFDNEIHLHRFLFYKSMGRVLNSDEHIDHQNRKRNDNRRKNIRLGTPYDNAQNRTKRKDNKSGYTGVYKFKDRWQVQITHNNKHITLGYTNTPEEGYELYKEYCIKNGLENRLKGDTI